VTLADSKENIQTSQNDDSLDQPSSMTDGNRRTPIHQWMKHSLERKGLARETTQIPSLRQFLALVKTLRTQKADRRRQMNKNSL
jgi:hypothetical protein